MRGGVTDAGQTNERTLKIELLSQWKLEAEFRNYMAKTKENGMKEWDWMCLKCILHLGAMNKAPLGLPSPSQRFLT